ncbi:MAG TPA: YigZ family protein [Candidatus Limivivens merdigallinarum]|uniref:YigZ family protein n=1 Tax=Candidatus Limivivens merdigallinarum TaxID=2840859 RepID=A0A9D0ZVD1_9FIRM|nr:YigZ family protein [Candidatus Limivivens merdigallinarum]
MKPVKILYEGGEGEIVEKKSRFIATVRPVETEEEALAFIAEMKKKYWNATHNCSAFVIGENQNLQRCSDDGEPQGTAGRPMLDVLLGEEIHNLAVVVTRYFGGTLLGTGGLVRAYSKAVQEGLKHCVIIEKQQGFLLKMNTDYNGVGKIQYILGKRKIQITSSEYAADVTLEALVPEEELAKVKEEITEATSGRTIYREEIPALYAFVDGEPLIF